MTDLSSELGIRRNGQLRKAVYQNRALSRAGLSERLFALLFTGLVYPQIWEDPEVDIEAMELLEGHRVVTIASGGCNVLAYLTRSPAHIDAVDLNRAHIALNRLKLAAVKHLPAQADLFRFFGEAGNRTNSAAYDRFLAPHLDAATRRYWEKRNWRGRRRIKTFDRNFYRTGLLGLFIAAGHKTARLYGVDPSGILGAHDLAAQRRFFEEELGPIFDRKLMRLVLSRKSSLFGLGIPPAQYDSLITSGDGSMASVLKARLEKLACDFPLNDNYFAWQAFARRYPAPGEGALPAYLDKANYEALKQNIGRAAVHHVNFTELLAKKPAGSVDRFVLLDAQDWMNDAQLNALWTEITRTAARGARVIFRTAAEESVLPGRVSDALLGEWRYAEEESRRYSARDRSAIYGGFHLYVKAAC
jgi:S-adenosylmethionine-diacylglycerol 3-amino-3-carboxypropyl transferase